MKLNEKFERKIQIRAIDEEERKITFTIISKNNAGTRWDWWSGKEYIEELDINGADHSELQTFYKDHDYRVDNAIGRIENVRKEDGDLVADVYFGSDEDSIKIYNKYKERILNDVSVGYRVEDFILTEKKGEPNHVLITRYSLLELSAVWKGFDKEAKAKRITELEQEKEKELRTAYENRNRKIKLMEKTAWQENNYKRNHKSFYTIWEL